MKHVFPQLRRTKPTGTFEVIRFKPEPHGQTNN